MTKWFANLRIGKKLLLLLSSGLGPAVGVAALALWGLTPPAARWLRSRPRRPG
jgi:hypothetical protein